LTTSPEPAKNIEIKENAQAFVSNGENTRFKFINNATCVVYVSFDAQKTAGKITTIVEMLKGKSELVSQLPPGEVYKSFNVWVGNNGFAIEKNIDNAVVCFKVEKDWIKKNNIDPSTITLDRYDGKKWDQLPTTTSGEDEDFLYFIAKTPEFGSFAIAVEKNQNLDSHIKDISPSAKEIIPEENSSNTKGNVEKEQNQKIPGFDMVLSIAAIFAALIYKGNRKY
jgi:PGF-pre-PGF domain-containing protein